jgi:hypothetical protein
VVGHDRFVGEHAYRQLTELYRALRLYVNCFQPSIKLQEKQRERKKVHCIYDTAKTPLQRLLLSGVLPAHKQQELTEVAQALDPIRLFEQLEQLQQAVFHCTVYQEQERRKRVLGWRRTHKDPFEGEWKQIISWLVANPERSSGDVFRELQRLSPGRYQPLQIRTLQRGMRKIRAYLLGTLEEQWQEEVISGPAPTLISPAENLATIT